MVVKKEGNKYCVYSKSGRKLGCHPTKTQAIKQLQAVEISKARRKKK